MEGSPLVARKSRNIDFVQWSWIFNRARSGDNAKQTSCGSRKRRVGCLAATDWSGRT